MRYTKNTTKLLFSLYNTTSKSMPVDRVAHPMTLTCFSIHVRGPIVKLEYCHAIVEPNSSSH